MKIKILSIKHFKTYENVEFNFRNYSDKNMFYCWNGFIEMMEGR